MITSLKGESPFQEITVEIIPIGIGGLEKKLKKGEIELPLSHKKVVAYLNSKDINYLDTPKNGHLYCVMMVKDIEKLTSCAHIEKVCEYTLGIDPTTGRKIEYYE